jgi:hypothetical protein
MKCERCGDVVAEGEQFEFRGKVLCEDCYIGAVQPPKTCDVAAVHAAKKHREAAGHTGTDGLTELQKDIVNFIRQSGRVTKEDLAAKFGLPQWELERQFAVLRHCELLKGAKVGDIIYLVPFEA